MKKYIIMCILICFILNIKIFASDDNCGKEIEIETVINNTNTKMNFKYFFIFCL